MARTVKEEEYALKRNEILDAAQRLIYAKGYEQMSIQDILDDLEISKGAFYHYFGSKQALMEALVERMLDEAEQLYRPIADDSHLPALEKLQRLFVTIGHWKTAHKAYLLALLRGWYADHNAIVRQKVQALGIKRVAPILAEIIRQGIREGALTTAYPDQAGEVVLFLVQGFGDTSAALLLSTDDDHHALRRMEVIAAACTDAVERVLGAPPGSLTLIDAETIRAWFAPSETERSAEYETVPAASLA